jgi:hypothetical protein
VYNAVAIFRMSDTLTLTLMMVAAIEATTLEELQHTMWLNPYSQNFTSDIAAKPKGLEDCKKLIVPS